MPATLCITGYGFDVDGYLAKANWESEKVFIRRKGDKRGWSGKLGVFEDSGFFIYLTDAGFDEFEAQQQDVISFLKRFNKNLELLAPYHIDGLCCISFGLEPYPPDGFSHTYTILPELSRLAGQYDLEIEMVNYFTYRTTNLRKRVLKRWPLRKERETIRYKYRRK